MPENSRNQEAMKNTNRKNGFILMIVIAMIPLIGMVLAILAANSKILLSNTRSAELHLRAENACKSGLAWAKQNRHTLLSLHFDEPLTLIIEEPNADITCSIVLLEKNETVAVVKITGYVKDRRFHADCSQKLHIIKR